MHRHIGILSAYIRSARNPMDIARLVVARYIKPRRATLRVGSRRFGEVTIRPRTTDISVVGEIFAGTYDAAMAAAGTPELIVDLGAHIGLASATFQRRFPTATIVAVEAHPENIVLLEQNVPTATVIAHPVAATHRQVRLEGTRLDGFRISDGGELDTITMDDIPGQLIGLLKVDIEGAEAELFADCSTWISRVNVLVCECHHPYRAESLLAAIARAGASTTSLEILRPTPFPYDLVTVRVGAANPRS